MQYSKEKRLTPLHTISIIFCFWQWNWLIAISRIYIVQSEIRCFILVRLRSMALLHQRLSQPGGTITATAQQKVKERVKKVAKQLSIMAYKKITCYKLNLSTTFIFLAGWDLNETHLCPASPCLMLGSQKTLGRGLAPCSLFLALQPPTVSKMNSLACCLVFGGGPLATVAWLIQWCWC